VTLQIAILLVAGIPVIAITQPFMPGIPGMAILILGVALLIIPLWRSATNLQGHVRAGAQVILEALAAQSEAPGAAAAAAPPASSAGLLPGLGNATAVPIAAASPAVGRTLKQINLRGLTGATVIAIDRDAADVIYPTGDETLRAGDALIVTGTTDAVVAAQELVAAPGAPPRTDQ
jgi:CPA2 family monovalent cation:H+ antiporter-2